jgi:hypothetical protein
VAAIASVTTLALCHADVTAMLAVLMSVIGALTVSTHTNTNGNMSRLLGLVERLSGLTPPTSPTPPPATTPPSTGAASTPDPGTGA